MKCNHCDNTITEVTVYEETYKVYVYNRETKNFEFKKSEPTQNKIIICNHCSRPITDQLYDKIRP